MVDFGGEDIDDDFEESTFSPTYSRVGSAEGGPGAPDGELDGT